MDELNLGQTEVQPQVIERPRAVTVFGVLSIIVGCYPFIRTYPQLYKILAPVLMSKTEMPGMPLFLLSCLISVGLSIWLIVLGIGLLRMKRWARSGSIIYSWVQIGLRTVNGGYTTVIILSGLANPPRGGRWPFWITYALMMLIGLIYPILLLIFMQTEKVKRAFLP